MGGLSLSSCFLQSCSLHGSEGAWVGSPADACTVPWSSSSLKSLSDRCRDTWGEQDRSPVFLGFFLLVSNFYMIHWAYFWLPYTYARCASLVGLWEEIVIAERAVACSEIAWQ